MSQMSHTRIGTALLLAAMVSACSQKKQKEDQVTAQLKQLQEKFGVPDNSPSGGEAKEGDPCSLLDPKEVEAAIGPLAAPPYRGTFRPQRGSDACRYDTRDHRRVLVTVTWSGGPVAMKMIHTFRGLTDAVAKQGQMKTGVTVLSTGDTLMGEWDEIAQGPMQCCDLHALRGDQLVELDWTGTRLDPTGAGALLNSAIKRLDHPLSIDGTAGLDSAQRLFDADAKDSAVDMCSLVPQVAAESIIGAKLLNPPKRGDGAAGARICTYDAPMAGAANMRREFDLDLRSWRDGAVEFASDQYAVGMGMRAVRNISTHDTTTKASDTTDHPPGPWDMIGEPASPGWEAVKGPVLVRVGAMGDRKAALGLLSRAVTALSANQ
jgi:hypothetical protein